MMKACSSLLGTSGSCAKPCSWRTGKELSSQLWKAPRERDWSRGRMLRLESARNQEEAVSPLLVERSARLEERQVKGPVLDSAGVQPLDVKEFRAHAHKMVDFIADYYERIDLFPVRSQVQPRFLESLIPEDPPEHPESLDEILLDIQDKIMPGVTHWQNPRFFGYYPANASTAGFLGDMLSGALNVIGFSWICSPAATELETITLDWLGKMLELPAAFLSAGSGGAGGGCIQGTASEAVLVTMLAARTRAIRKMGATEDDDVAHGRALSRLVAYSSDQAHSSIMKAGIIAGLPRGNIRFIAADASTNYALSPASLKAAMDADVAKGLVPFFVCATVGTTSSAAVDPIKDIAASIDQWHGATSAADSAAEVVRPWLHIDAAYAGSACICPEIRGRHLDGLGAADSFNMNAHKWLLTNFDCSCLWVKDHTALVAALSTSPEYLRNKASDANTVIDYKDWQIPLGRRFRSLKLWMVIRMHGAEGLRSYIRSHVAMAAEFESWVRADSRFQVTAPRLFSLVCFRLLPPTSQPDSGNALNAELLEKVNETGQAFLTHTVLQGSYTLRMAIGGTRTQLQHVETTWQLISAMANEVLKGNAKRSET